MHIVRPPAVAGAFYPGEAAALAGTLASLLAAARAQRQDQDTSTLRPKALIVPHAGYIYSGAMAALAYVQLAALRDTVRRVVLLGPAHRIPLRGLALPGADALATPLGQVPIDTQAVAALAALPQVTTHSAAHAQEHALEVQLPFLQTVLDDFTVLPLVVGHTTPEEVAQVLDAVWGGPETLIVISSDLSHYLPYPRAQRVDEDTVQRILTLQGPLTHEQACGGTPINGLLLAARKHGLRPRLLGLCNSGDTAGDRRRVVGYAAIAFTEERRVVH